MARRLPSAALFVLLVATAAGGAESGGPLESTKQELRKLDRSQQPGSGPSATEGLRPSLPAIQAPGTDSLPALQLTEAERRGKERQRQKDERKNWLVNGVEQLERKDKDKAAGVVTTDETADGTNNPRTAEGSDPQYLLKLYDEQKKNEDSHKAEAKPQRAPQADPLAPFLQGWLGNSPVRGQFFDEFVRKPEGPATTANGPAGPGPVGPGRDFGGFPVQPPGPAGDAAPKANPYLVELDPPRPSEPAPGAVAPQNTFNSGGAAPTAAKPLIPLAEPPVEPRPPERKSLPSPLAEDKKYFPQLKRF